MCNFSHLEFNSVLNEAILTKTIMILRNKFNLKNLFLMISHILWFFLISIILEIHCPLMLHNYITLKCNNHYCRIFFSVANTSHLMAIEIAK